LSSALHRRGLCFVLAGPSGGGKSSITRAMLTRERDVELSISVTTRAARAGEIHGTHYHFIDQAAFDTMVAAGELLEHAGVFGRNYGTPRGPVEAALSAGRDVLFDIDWQGFRQLRAAMPADVVGVFLLPPSLPILRQRLSLRGDPPADIDRRMDAAWNEIIHAGEFDHVVINDVFDPTLGEVHAILRAARTATSRQTGLAGYISGLTSQV